MYPAYTSARSACLGALLAGLFALGFAYVSQYGFGLHPCHLCYYQRIPYALIVFFSLLGMYRPTLARNMLWLCVAGFAVDAGIAAYHAGVEWQWWEGPSSCTASFAPDMSLDAVRAKILGAASVSCAEAAFRFLGLSMAGWNALYALSFALLFAYSRLTR